MIRKVLQHIPEGLTIIFEGKQRSGKTLSDVIWALDAYQRGKNVFSNIQLGFPHEPLEFSDISLKSSLEGQATSRSKFWNGFVLIDELNFYFDSRRSMKQGNIEFGAFLLQQKKQGCTLTGTTHDLLSLDVRIRENYDYLISPEVIPAYPNAPQAIRMRIENGPLQRTFSKTITLDARPFLGLYDSFAVYDPFKGLDKKKGKRPKSRVIL